MNITYIVGSFPKLSETFVLSQITGLIDMGHEVNIIAARPTSEEIVHDDVEEYGLLEKTTYVKGSPLKPGFEISTELLDTLLFADIIHAHFAAWPAEIAMALSRMTKIPFIFTAHAYDIFTSPDIEGLKSLSQSASRIITVTEFNKNYILEMIGNAYTDKIEIIRCGIDTEKFFPEKRGGGDTVTILTAGRLVEKKGIRFAIEAFSRLSDSHRLELRIIGSGPMKEKLQSLAEELNLQNKIKLLGEQPQSVMVNEMKRADIFLLPCVTAENGDMEGLPVVLLEAQAMELPVVSSTHTGIPEGIINGKTGFLTPEKDVSAVAEKLEMLINNPSLRLEMGQRGRKHIEERFNAKNEIEKVEKLMRDLKSNVNISSISAERREAVRSMVHGVVSELVLQKDEKLKQKDEKLKQKDEKLKQKDEAINSLLNTWSWRITKPLRVTAEWLKGIYANRAYNRQLRLLQGGGSAKTRNELKYWKTCKEKEGILSNTHYEYFYTTHFGLDKAFFNGKKILDIGCGPRGSLEWVDIAAERVGIDPLAESYRKLGTHRHKMQYMATNSEQIPFPDQYFDVVSSFNSLDHVDNLDGTVNEIIRVIAPGGLFLLLTDVNHDSTVCEPIVYSWDIVEKFLPNLKVLEEKHYEKSRGGMYEGIRAEVPYDHTNKIRRYGILSAKLIKTT